MIQVWCVSFLALAILFILLPALFQAAENMRTIEALRKKQKSLKERIAKWEKKLEE